MLRSMKIDCSRGPALIGLKPNNNRSPPRSEVNSQGCSELQEPEEVEFKVEKVRAKSEILPVGGFREE